MNLFKRNLKKMENDDNVKHEMNDKKKIENIVFLVVILIITIIILNTILKKDNPSKKNINESTYKVLADDILNNTTNNDDSIDFFTNDLEKNLSSILSTIKGVGKVKVFINYSESSSIVAMYDEKTTVSSTEETDSAGGLRNTTSTETQKDIIFSEENGDQSPVTEKIIMPTIEGAIITAKGATNSQVKTNIISAVQAVTGLSIDKIQVFEME